MAYTKYSLTPANNTAAPPDGAPEGMLPSAVNDTMRDMMAQIRDAGDGIRDGTYTMTAAKITGGTITGVTFTGNTFSNPTVTGVSTFAAGTVSAPAITTTGDTNTGIFFPAADTIAFTEGGVESLRIDASGNVGIGATPVTFSNYKYLQVNATNNSYLKLTNSTTGATINDGFDLVATGSDAGLINRENGAMFFSTDGTERMRIPAAGGVQAVTTISVGNATPSASGAGITFPATQSASSDANTLDDYEEGTWTPSLGGNTTYNNQEGKYTKIGNTVFIEGHLNINVLGTGSVSTISGLPFTAGATFEGAATITYFAGLAVNVIQPVIAINANNTNMSVLSRTTAGTGSAYVNIFGNSARIYFAGYYFV